jgi:hypothetical protein
MFSYRNVRALHLEITDKCNAACPMCPRNESGASVNPRLCNTELTLASAQKLFPASFVEQLEQVYLCGNFGDPIAGRDTLEILKYFRAVNPRICLGMHTNGSARAPAWWAELGALLSGAGDYCKFGIDGLADTNHLYRQQTNWDRIMASTRAFIQAGGRAHWEYLVFRHNEHQVETARALSVEMGFSHFFVKKTSRFFDYAEGRLVPFPVRNADGAIVRHLLPPSDEKFVNSQSAAVEKSQAGESPLEPKESSGLAEPKAAEPVAAAENPEAPRAPAPERIKEEFGNLREYFKRASVDCLSLKEKTIYISAAGKVFPCCFLGGQYQYADRGVDGDELARLMKAGSWPSREPDLSDGHSRPLEEIVDGPWFRAVSDSWEKKGHGRGRIGTCTRQCGTHYQPFVGEYA